MASEVLLHRVQVLETRLNEQEGRVRALEIAYAKAIGYCAGAAFAGSALFQLLTWLVQR